MVQELLQSLIMITAKQQKTMFFAFFPLVYLGVGIAFDPLMAPLYLDPSWRGSTLLDFLNWHISIFTSIELIGLCLAIPLTLLLCKIIPNHFASPRTFKISIPINLGITILFLVNFGYLSAVLVLTATVMIGLHLFKEQRIF